MHMCVCILTFWTVLHTPIHSYIYMFEHVCMYICIFHIYIHRHRHMHTHVWIDKHIYIMFIQERVRVHEHV